MLSSGAVLLLFFVGAGYALSDAMFFRQLVSRNGIATPDDAWEFLGSHIRPARPGTPTPRLSISARYMLTQQKELHCDAGALLMATILREIGYRSRLVDLHGHDGISHHTVLEVEENGHWYVYDTLLRQRRTTLKDAARGYGFELARPVRRPSWSTYRSIVYNNAFLKFFIFKLRGIPG